MTSIALFASTFALVFFLGLQSLNVNNGHYRAAFFTSFGIGIFSPFFHEHLFCAFFIALDR